MPDDLSQKAPAAPASAETSHESVGAHPPAPHKVLGLDSGGWVAAAMAVVIVIFLWKKVPALITSALDAKIANIRQQLDEAAALRREAEALKGEYEAKAKAAELEADKIRARASEEAQAIVLKAETDAAEMIARRTRMAEDKIAVAEAQAATELRAWTAKAATQAAAQIIATHRSTQHDHHLVDKVIADLDHRPH